MIVTFVVDWIIKRSAWVLIWGSTITIIKITRSSSSRMTLAKENPWYLLWHLLKTYPWFWLVSVCCLRHIVAHWHLVSNTPCATLLLILSSGSSLLSHRKLQTQDSEVYFGLGFFRLGEKQWIANMYLNVSSLACYFEGDTSDLEWWHDLDYFVNKIFYCIRSS